MTLAPTAVHEWHVDRAGSVNRMVLTERVARGGAETRGRPSAVKLRCLPCNVGIVFELQGPCESRSTNHHWRTPLSWGYQRCASTAADGHTSGGTRCSGLRERHCDSN